MRWKALTISNCRAIEDESSLMICAHLSDGKGLIGCKFWYWLIARNAF